MTAKTDRTIAISFTAVIVAALSSCTNVNENSRADMAPKPAAGHQAIAKAATPAGPQVASATVNGSPSGVPATLATATNQTGGSPATMPTQSAITALTNTSTGNGAIAAINGASATGVSANAQMAHLAGGPNPLAAKPGYTQVASLGPTVANTPSSANAPANVADNEPIGLENEALQPDVIHAAIPTPRPASLGGSSAAAYAAPARPTVTSFAMLDAQFDTSAPGPVKSLTSETAKSTSASEGSPAPRGPTVINGLVNKYAALYGMPSALIHRVIHRESRYNPSAYNRGNYGLMQIRYNTARSLGYDGPAEGLFDPETNLKYAIKYLRGAWMVADNNNDNAVRLYARGYYNDAKRKGLLDDVQ